MKQIPSSKLSEAEFTAQYADVTDETKRLWESELNVLQELDRVCTKYHLKWFADSGTLLGGVRHGGFIPWDDDIDLVMFSDDYRKLCEVAAEEFKAPFFFQNWETEDGFPPFSARLRNSDVLVRTSFDESRGKDWNRGAFVDIFTLHHVPDNAIKRKLQQFLLKLIRACFHGYEARIYQRPMAESKALNRAFVVLDTLVRPFADHRKLSRMYQRVADWEKKKTKKMAMLAFDPGKANLIFDSEWLENPVKIPFMDTSIPAPGDWDQYLTKEYGNYMQPVKRLPRHGPLKIEE